LNVLNVVRRCGKLIFALDIGTRKVAGLLVSMNEQGKMVVHDLALMEHEHRAMLDGQIHDVEKVAKTVRAIKEELERRNNVKLEKVAVALAGRFLKTYIGEASADVSGYSEITSDIVTRLELDAVADATKNIEPHMYCVGYSVLRYELDGSWFKKLEGLKGEKASVKVVSTFLPNQVVEAMLAVVKRVGLVITHLTLEPIAAVNVTVPEDLRILNIALVDVGAGTSDIAISKDGAIVAYGMVPLAGDEITEAITKKFLLDFQTAEYVKRNFSNNEKLKVRNILDKELEITKDEVISAIKPIIDEITKQIASEIFELNGERPQVVMVVGGGAKVPLFEELLAKHLGMEPDYVSLKTPRNLDFVDRTGLITGSEFITPLGIGYTALTRTGGVFEQVTVNGEPIQLIGFKGAYTVWEVLLQSGRDVTNFLGRPGRSLVVELDGQPVVIRGQLPVAAPVKINGKAATLRDIVHHGDNIEIGEAINGKDASVTLYDVVPPVRLKSLESGQIIEYHPGVLLNGREVNANVQLNDGDVIKTVPVKVKKLREFLSNDLVKIEYSVNNVYREVYAGEVKIFRGELELSDENSVTPGEELEYAIIVKYPKVSELPELEKMSVLIKLNGEQRLITKDGALVWVNDRLVPPDYEIHDGDKIRTQVVESNGFIVADVLALFNVDVKNVKSYRIIKNGQPAGFTDSLENGDELEVTFEFKTPKVEQEG